MEALSSSMSETLVSILATSDNETYIVTILGSTPRLALGKLNGASGMLEEEQRRLFAS